MTKSSNYHVVIFESVNQTMWATKLLKAKQLPHKLIPVPRHISSDCGVCIRIDSSLVDQVRLELAGIDGFVDIIKL
jgi:hypothetical protein